MGDDDLLATPHMEEGIAETQQHCHGKHTPDDSTCRHHHRCRKDGDGQQCHRGKQHPMAPLHLVDKDAGERLCHESQDVVGEKHTCETA